jgi:glycosyltransferase involved in cell wall biosynthesis
MSRSLTICVCTPYRADAEPRGPRHASALAALNPEWQVIFVDCAPNGFTRIPTPALATLPNLRWITHNFAVKGDGLLALVKNKLYTWLAAQIFRFTGKLSPALFSPIVVGLTKKLAALHPDVIHAHNVEMLLPSLLALPERGKLIFDCMEFYSDMGEGQTKLFRRAVCRLETMVLPRCLLLTTSSPQVSAAYQETYGDLRTISLYNCPSRVDDLPCPAAGPLRLYWRNSVLGLSQRGLAEVLDAMVSLPAEITLHLQGRPGLDCGVVLQHEIKRRGLSERVFVLPPHAPDGAVAAAATFNVGLCLERSGNRNHELTVSNKMFDYLMAGLAVVSSDLPGLREVVERSEAGLLFQPGSADSLREQILRLHESPDLLMTLRNRARSYATREGNRELQMTRFQRKFEILLQSQ